MLASDPRRHPRMRHAARLPPERRPPTGKGGQATALMATPAVAQGAREFANPPTDAHFRAVVPSLSAATRIPTAREPFREIHQSANRRRCAYQRAKWSSAIPGS